MIISHRKIFWVLEGDWGGQIYLSVPVNVEVGKRIGPALCIVDAVEWNCNDGKGLAVLPLKGRPGRPIIGGMGGGMFPLGRIWTHPGLNSNLKIWVEAFLFGEVGLPSVEKILEWLIEEDVFHRSICVDGLQKLRRRACQVHARALECMGISMPVK